MIVGLDLLFLVPGQTGGRETYARELVRGLVVERPDLALVCFVNRETAAGEGWWGEGALVVPVASSGVDRASWAIGELVKLPRRAGRVDVLHSVANFGPFGGDFARVLTVHDLLWRRLPDTLGRPLRLGTDAMVAGAARRADRVITVSRASAADLEVELGLGQGRVQVVPNGVTVPAALSNVNDGWVGGVQLEAGGRAVVLSVASDLPHKNLGALVGGLALLDGDSRPLLVLAGHGTDTGDLLGRAVALGVADSVRLLGAVGADELEALYAAADVVVTATRFEGFGLPVLEAMARGVPVACSDLPVLREVAGDAAVWLDPADPSSIAAAIRRALRDPEPLREAGRAQAARFSWRAAARATADVYERAVEVKRGERQR